MKKSLRATFVLFGLVIAIVGILVWAMTSPSIDDYYSIYTRGEKSESDLAFAFTIALRRNHSSAYQMTAFEQHSEIDEWMRTHEPQFCNEKPHIELAGAGTNIGYQVIYGCANAKPDKVRYSLKIDDIIIDEMQVTSWGEIVEESE